MNKVLDAFERQVKEEGKLEGKIEVKIEIARKLIQKKISLNEIKEITNLSDNEIDAIRKQLEI